MVSLRRSSRVVAQGGVLFLGLMMAGAGPARACDPDHEWVLVEERTSPGAAPRAMARALLQALSRTPDQGPVAIIQWRDEEGSPLATDRATAVGSLLAEGLGRRPVLPDDRVQPQRGPAESAHDPEVLGAVSRSFGASRLVRAALVSSEFRMRLFADHRPANRGLWKEEHLQRVVMRISIQAPDGRYLFIDEVPGTISDAHVFALGLAGRRAPVEIFLDEPAGPPLHWVRQGGGGHLTL